MATVRAFIRVSTKKKESAYIRFCLRDGRGIQLFHKSEFVVSPDVWDKKTQSIKAKISSYSHRRDELNKQISERKILLTEIYNGKRDERLTSELLDITIKEYLNPEVKQKSANANSVIQLFDDFLEKTELSINRRRHYKVVKRLLIRFVSYKQLSSNPDYNLQINSLSTTHIEEFEKYIKDEYLHIKKYPAILNTAPESRTPAKRGQNTINGILGKFRTVVLWANDNSITTNNPFKKYPIKESKYGTPIYITIEERNKIYNTKFTGRPSLEVQKDIFVFHCFVGCRVGDLVRLKKSNFIDDSIEYIANKTKDETPITIKVPLFNTPIEILNKYSNLEGDRLLPFISQVKYNKAIKEIFALAGITRIVTRLNTITRKEEQVPINKIASSHLARRTFVGNLYKHVKDPNLIGKLTGHKEGSKAFARYRDIDEDIKKELVKLLE